MVARRVVVVVAVAGGWVLRRRRLVLPLRPLGTTRPRVSAGHDATSRHLSLFGCAWFCMMDDVMMERREEKTERLSVLHHYIRQHTFTWRRVLLVSATQGEGTMLC